MTPRNHRSFVAIDRDGTLIEERHYLSDPDQVALLPGAVEGLRLLQHLEVPIVVVTNQSGVGRGYFDEQRLSQIHQRMQAILTEVGITLQGIYYCPHLPDAQCPCRKPRLGMLQQAALDLSLEVRHSIVIGDKPCDIELGQRAGGVGMLVKTGYGAKYATSPEVSPDYIVQDLWEAAQVIQRQLLQPVLHPSSGR